MGDSYAHPFADLGHIERERVDVDVEVFAIALLLMLSTEVLSVSAVW